MVNSASMALAEFKSQRLGSLLSGTGSTVDAPSMMANPSLSDTASSRLARSAPSSSSTAFLQNVRQGGANYNDIVMAGLDRRRQQAAQMPSYAPGYTLPAGAGKGGSGASGGPRGAYGLTVPAAQAFGKLQQAYSAAGQGNLGVVSGGRTYAQQQQLYALYKAGKGNKAAPPGTSLHESGIAVDLAGAAHNAATQQHAWLRQNAANFGWYWVGKNFGEDWHWEYHPEWGGK